MASSVERLISDLTGLPVGCLPELGVASQPQSPGNGNPCLAAAFWCELEGSSLTASAASEQPSGAGKCLPSLAQRSKSFIPAGQATSDGRSAPKGPIKSISTRHDRLPPLRSEGGNVQPAPHTRNGAAGSGMQRTASMFAMPAAGGGGTGSSTSGVSLSGSPGGSPGGGIAAAACAASSFRTCAPIPQRLAVLCEGFDEMGLIVRGTGGDAAGTDQRRSVCDGGDAAVPPPPTAPECDDEAEVLRGSLTARCAAAEQAWKSLDDFSSLRLLATGRNCTVWDATPKAAWPGVEMDDGESGQHGGCTDSTQARGVKKASVVIKAYNKACLGRHALQRLLLEQRLLQTVRHPHIVRGLGSFEEDGSHFLVTEFCDGRSVQQFVSYWRRRNQEDFERGSETTVVPEEEAAQLVLAPLLDALAYLHARGIVHRDVKASNAVFSRSGCLKLIDFGLSLDLRSGDDGPRCRIGTPAYMAPELLGEEPPSPPLVDRTDVWAAGVLAFQLLTGELPWFHEVPALLQHMVEEEAVPFKMLQVMGASAAATDFVRQALTKDASHRPTAAQLRAHPWLLQHCGGQPLDPSRFAA